MDDVEGPPSRRAPGCIFCGATPRTNQHVWPQALSLALNVPFTPTPPGERELQKIRRRRRDEDGVLSSWEEPRGYLAVRPDIKVKAVCRVQCNAGWMRCLEAEAQRLLVRMWSREHLVLDHVSVEVLRRWAVKDVHGVRAV